MKSYTDLEQSRKLAEILPIDSADMFYDNGVSKPFILDRPSIKNVRHTYPCWSLAALLDVLSKSAYFINEAGIVELSSIKATKWCVSVLNCGKIENCYADNPIDACYEMIIKLHEQNLL